MTERMIGLKGPMFSEKTDEIIRFAIREEIAGNVVQIFKPIMSDRDEGINKVVSRTGSEHRATPIRHPLDIFEKLEEGVSVVLVDEVQFFGQKDEDDDLYVIENVFDELLQRDIKVIFAGLPTDFRGVPFGPVPNLLARSYDTIPLTAICTHEENGKKCGEDATETQRFVDGEFAHWEDPVVLIGDKKEGYDARCYRHKGVEGRPRIFSDR